MQSSLQFGAKLEAYLASSAFGLEKLHTRRRLRLVGLSGLGLSLQFPLQYLEVWPWQAQVVLLQLLEQALLPLDLLQLLDPLPPSDLPLLKLDQQL
jgi:hypothetical protein